MLQILWENMEKQQFLYGFILNNNVLLLKTEEPVWYTVYHHLPVVTGVN